jgi:hypothetical protein
MANSIFSGKAHPEGRDNPNRIRTDSEQKQREADCAERIRSDCDEVFRSQEIHKDRLRTGGK